MLDVRSLPLIEVAGSHREMGRQFGEQHRPGSICAHVREDSSSKTVASLISEPAEGRLHATFGSPCESDYVTYAF